MVRYVALVVLLAAGCGDGGSAVALITVSVCDLSEAFGEIDGILLVITRTGLHRLKDETWQRIADGDFAPITTWEAARMSELHITMAFWSTTGWLEPGGLVANCEP